MTPASHTAADQRIVDRSGVAAVLLGVWAAVVGLTPTSEYKLLATLPLLAGAVAWWTILTPERWLAFFFFCSLLLPPLPFPFGNSGIHIAPLVALIGLAVGALRIAEWRAILRGNLAILFALFLSILAGSSALAALYSGWEIGLGSFARVLLFGIGVYVFLYTLAGPRAEESNPFAQARLLYGIALAGAVFACVDFYFQFPAPAGYSRQFVWLEQSVVRRAQGVFYDAATLGNFCAFFLAMVLVAWFPAKGQRVLSRLVLIPGALIFTAALIFSGSRASIVAVIVAGCALAYVRRLKIRRVFIAAAALLGATAAAVRFALPAFSANYWFRIAGSMRDFWSYPNEILSGRLAHWKTLVDFLAQHPWPLLFGIGYKTIPYTAMFGAGAVADNTYLSLLVETGIVGLTVFLLLNAAILRTSYRAARSDNSHASFFGGWMLCFWCGEMVQMLSGDLITYWRLLPVFFWVLALAARESGREFVE
ncbi:MAG TPA: O-antigen ligase family protein [Bryobacteraceae bacterium]|jgi:O-antigen ligase